MWCNDWRVCKATQNTPKHTYTISPRNPTGLIHWTMQAKDPTVTKLDYFWRRNEQCGCTNSFCIHQISPIRIVPASRHSSVVICQNQTAATGKCCRFTCVYVSIWEPKRNDNQTTWQCSWIIWTKCFGFQHHHYLLAYPSEVTGASFQVRLETWRDKCNSYIPTYSTVDSSFTPTLQHMTLSHSCNSQCLN